MLQIPARTIPLNGIDINYLDEGEGEVLLMVHNLTSNIRDLALSIPELSRHYRVIAADVRGHGLTTHEDDLDAAKAFYTFDNMVEDSLALLDHLGIGRFHLFGQAYWGANIAFNLFRRVPGRVRALAVSSSYMISTDPGVPPYSQLSEQAQKNFIRMHELARAEGMDAVFETRKSNRQFWGPRIFDDPEIMQAFAEAHHLTSAAAFVTIPYLSHERRAEIAGLLNERSTCLMMLLGVDDSNNERTIREMRQDYADTHVVLLPESSHYPTIENPGDFNQALLNFLAGAEKFHGV